MKQEVKIIEVKGAGGVSRIHVGEKLSRIDSHLPAGVASVIVTDERVKELYAGDFPPHCPIITMGTGEGIKNLSTVEMILRELM
ncbi:MAG: 3-dehydroquinate synthase, partial [Desulfamplus sp.]|nr:3-dehydroquinate synthase [Desulfamplus sp.]